MFCCKRHEAGISPAFVGRWVCFGLSTVGVVEDIRWGNPLEMLPVANVELEAYRRTPQNPESARTPERDRR